MLYRMPLYMDRHELAGSTAADVAAAHAKDVEVQDRFGVRYLTYWFDYDRGRAFCLAEGPNRQAVEDVHRNSHGMVAPDVIEVDGRAVERFLGPVADHATGEAYVETAFRAILFTDIEGSTDLTQRLGDRAAMEILRRHDRVVRHALSTHGGNEVKHTGDGIMATFRSVAGAIAAAIDMQRTLVEPDASTDAPLRVRIGVSAGEPVTENDDLFGAAVQLASRLCERASPGSVLVSSGVRDLALGKGFAFEKGGTLRLKGFPEAIRVFTVSW
jgi:class 3 adenylate cyclase